ncbi:hypothetical protein [Stappia sp. ICDLI1TA098]
MKFIFLLHIAFIFLVFNAPAQAACSSPAGQASQTRYDFTANKLYYCNDTDWVEMGGGSDAVSYKSNFVSYTNSSLQTFPHPFGSKPSVITVWLKNITPQHGWSVGDEIVVLSTGEGSYGVAAGVVPYADNNNIYVRMGAWPVAALSKTGGYATLSSTHWQVGVSAIK